MSGWDTYDRAAAAYRAVRPTYPDEIFECVRAYAPALPPTPTVLEVGIGSGQATRQMAELGWRVVGLEPGHELAATARADLTEFENVSVETVRFEDVDLPENSIDVVTAATAWHWVDPQIGIPKAARLLRPSGLVALWWNAHVTDTPDPRWSPIRDVYERVASHLAHLAPLTPDRPDYDPTAELRASGWFTNIEEHRFSFAVAYSADQFLTLIDTYASHRPLTGETRAQLHEQLRHVIDSELDGVVTKPYECLLVLGTPQDGPG